MRCAGPKLQQHPSPGTQGSVTLLVADDECLQSLSTTPALLPLEPTNLTSSFREVQFLLQWTGGLCWGYWLQSP